MKEKIKKWVINSALRIGHLKDSERTLLELIVILYLNICFLSLTIIYFVLGKTIPGILYSLALGSMILLFISKATLFNKFKFLEQFNGVK